MFSFAALLLIFAVGAGLFLLGAYGGGPVPAVIGMLVAVFALCMFPIVAILELAEDDDCPYEYATEYCR